MKPTSNQMHGTNFVKSLMTISAMIIGVLFTANTASAGPEIMRDRCTANVAIPTTGYGNRPDSPGTVILTRPASGYSEWTSPFTVRKGKGGRIRWWCASTIGNWADIGTYRVKFDLPKALKCAAEVGATVYRKSETGEKVEVGDFKCLTSAVHVKPGASAYNGWTPERSRCGNRSNLIQARLGPNRLLQIKCLGRTSETVLVKKKPSTTSHRSSSRPRAVSPFHFYNLFQLNQSQWGSIFNQLNR